MLNQQLYGRLVALFGDVGIVNENTPMEVRSITRHSDGRTVPWKFNSGEQYRVNCPFCGDTRQRLYISYAWGADYKVNYPSSKLVVCHNERCQENNDPNDRYGRNPRKYLEYNLGTTYLSMARKGMVQVEVSSRATKPAERMLEFPRAEWVSKMHLLPEAHDAVVYFKKQRGFDLERLYTDFGVVLAHTYPVQENGKDYSFLAGRAFIPVIVGGVYVGWQARVIDALGLKPRNKYFNCPGWQKSQFIYNLDNARKYEVGLLVEGVTDAWRTGGGAFSTLGKTISASQEDAIVSNWGAVGVLYDPDTDTDKADSARKALQRLSVRVPKVFRVHLPDGRDPAECDRSVIWDCVERDASRVGVTITRPEGF